MAVNNEHKPVITDFDTSQMDTKTIAIPIENMRIVAYNHRRIHERNWYDNNFFDDGYHFRYLSRTTNRIVDLSERATIYTPQRAIPKSSRQIRGIANLLLSSDPTPSVYPEEISKSDFPDPQVYAQEQERQKQIALKRGYWLEEEWKTPDKSGETMLEKLALMPILTMKHSVSYMQIWSDVEDESIRTQVYDAFDLYLLGYITALQDQPFIIKATPMLISEIQANENFSDKKYNVMPDNKQAGSEIKQAYMRARYGRDSSADQAGTAILYEAFLKEHINEYNIKRIRQQKDGDRLLKHRDIGDTIIRQVFVASSQCLRDEYLDMDEYPFVDFRMEPGPMYQVPMIERFKNANKSLDSAVSRMERYFHTMVTGIWLKRRGEQFKISNIAGGQILEYDQTAPVQAPMTPLGPWTFEFVSLLTNFIEEQGVSTTTLGKVPTGVRSNAAIESLKEAEYANLIISTRRFNQVCRKIAKKMFEIADENYVHPKSISHNVKGKTDYFEVIGSSAAKGRKKLGLGTPDEVITLSKDTKVDIEIEQGMAYTREGQKAAAMQLFQALTPFVQMGAIPMPSFKVALEKFLETYQFGSTAEFMSAWDEAAAQGGMSDQDMQKMKVALLQALQEADEIGPKKDEEDAERMLQATKLGSLQALKDAGLVKHIQDAGNAANAEPVKESVSINYKDAPEDIKRQMEQEAGFQPSQTISPAGSDQIIKHKQSSLQEVKLQQEAQRTKEMKGGSGG